MCDYELQRAVLFTTPTTGAFFLTTDYSWEVILVCRTTTVTAEYWLVGLLKGLKLKPTLWSELKLGWTVLGSVTLTSYDRSYVYVLFIFWLRTYISTTAKNLAAESHMTVINQ